MRGYQLAVERMVEFDKEMIAGLIARGFKYDLGEDETGHQMKYRRRGGGYYLDAGCSAPDHRRRDRPAAVRPDRTVRAGRRAAEGRHVVPADLLVLATGYHTQQELVRRVLGDDVAAASARYGAWARTARWQHVEAHRAGWPVVHGRQPDPCRIYSKYLALQIKALEQGLIAGSAAPRNAAEKVRGRRHDAC